MQNADRETHRDAPYIQEYSRNKECSAFSILAATSLGRLSALSLSNETTAVFIYQALRGFKKLPL